MDLFVGIIIGIIIAAIANESGKMWRKRYMVVRRDAGPMTTQYPHASGDVMVLGPECFIDRDRKGIMYQGELYEKQEDNTETHELPISN